MLVGSTWANNQYFNPKQIGGLVQWIDATDPAGNGIVPSNGTSLTDWVDKSGTGNSFNQSTGANKPTFNTNQINGKPAVTFNGSTNYMTGTATNFPLGSAGRTCFAVITISSLTQAYFYSSGQATAAGRLSMGIFNGGAGVVYFLNFEMNGTGDTGNTSLSTATPYLYYFNSAAGALSSTFSTRIAGADQTLTGSNVALNSAYTSGSAIGCIVTPTVLNWPGQIAEIIFYNNSLSAAQVSLVNNYLKNKWAITP
jgi:hypothetical protein